MIDSFLNKNLNRYDVLFGFPPGLSTDSANLSLELTDPMLHRLQNTAPPYSERLLHWLLQGLLFPIVCFGIS